MKEATEFWWLIVGIVTAFAVALWKSIRNLRRLSRMIDEFLGYEGHPGIPDRVTKLESDVAKLSKQIEDLTRLVSIQTPTAVVNVTPTTPGD